MNDDDDTNGVELDGDYLDEALRSAEDLPELPTASEAEVGELCRLPEAEAEDPEPLDLDSL